MESQKDGRKRNRKMEGRETERWKEEEEERGQKKKKVKYVSYLSEVDMKIEQLLREQDPIRFKREIRRWARAVVRYARQLSRRRSSVSSFRFDEDQHKDFDDSA